MTPTLTYANTMLDIYLNADDWQPQAIRHYLELAMSERTRTDRERELKELVDVPEGLPGEQEAQAWLNATKGILDFWNTDEDAAYDRERELVRMMEEDDEG